MKRLESLQESLQNIKANQSMNSLQTTFTQDVDRSNQGILERMRKTLFGDGDEEEENEQVKMITDNSFVDPGTVDLDKSKLNWDQIEKQATASDKKNLPSVLDQLESYWEEHDAQGGSCSNAQFGIMAKQADDMMLLRGQKSGKRSGAFCVGI